MAREGEASIRVGAVTVLRGRGSSVVEDALILGELAIHETVSAVLTEFTVTHVRTGLVLRKDLTWNQAIKFWSSISSMDWTFENAEAIPPAIKQAAMKALREALRG